MNIIKTNNFVLNDCEYVQFSVLISSEIEKLSICNITQTEVFDNLSNSIRNGLHDPRMGPSNRFENCATCGLRFGQCPGHAGHIGLATPAYNPVMFLQLIKLLSKSCVQCHCLKMPAQVKKLLAAKLQLLKQNKLIDEVTIQQLFLHQSENEFKQTMEQILNKETKNQNSSLVQEQFDNLIKEIFKNYQRCNSCKATSPKLIYVNSLKIFRENKSDNFEVNDNNEDSKEINNEDEINLNSNIFQLPINLLEELKLLFVNEKELLYQVYKSPEQFFIQNLLVIPNRLRPPKYVANTQNLHPITISLQNIIKANQQLGLIKQDSQSNTLLTNIILLQQQLNSYIDSSKSQSKSDEGLRQQLEKKEGLFRQNIQGKRVNFAARSVISPDANLQTSEVGIPDTFAKTLTFPEAANHYNVELLKVLVINGAKYPGANYLDQGSQKQINLSQKTQEEREILAEQLLTQPSVVYRHVLNGDPLIFNRQPSLHRSSMLVHQARVMPGHSRSIRFHYANCAGYNADFDGDEMNLHYLQNYQQVAEALELALNDNHYVTAAAGKPIRGLFQDSVIGGILLTKLDNLMSKEEFDQLCWNGCASINQRMTQQDRLQKLQQTKIEDITNANCFSATNNMKFVGSLDEQKEVVRGDGDGFLQSIKSQMAIYKGNSQKTKQYQKVVVIKEQFKVPEVQPCILYPQQLYSGKQVVSVLLKFLCQEKKISMQGGTTVPPDTWGVHAKTESKTIILDNELLTGLIEKKNIAAQSNSLVHYIQELIGNEAAGTFITTYGRLTTYMLQKKGLTCSLEDMILQKEADSQRDSIYKNIDAQFENITKQFLVIKENNISTEMIKKALRHKLQTEQDINLTYDAVMQKETGQLTSQISQTCKPARLITKIPRNHLAFMILGGAKGSAVNLQMMTAVLGQQCLEGRRVPCTQYLKTLPCYRQLDSIHPIAGGYVFDRFLTSLRPQSFFFHHQAGREGLIDTAVKTSTSGYFQRCIIKSMEGVSVKYDGTVRDGDNMLLQPIYGGDGIEQCKSGMLNQFEFIRKNKQVYNTILENIHVDDLQHCIEKIADYLKEIDLNTTKQNNYILSKSENKLLRKCYQYYLRIMEPNSKLIGEDEAFSQLNEIQLQKYVDSLQLILQCQNELPINSIQTSYNNASIISQTFKNQLNSYINSNQVSKQEDKYFKELCIKKYSQSLVQPGEAVGVISGQSVGEPATQLTLNTFHLAGHGAANVTLGIPRLREIVMMAKKDIKTPHIIVKCMDQQSADQVKMMFRRVDLYEKVRKITIKTKIVGQQQIVETGIQLDSNIADTSNSEVQKAIEKFIQKFQKLVTINIKQQMKKEITSFEAEVVRNVIGVCIGDNNEDEEKSQQSESSQSTSNNGQQEEDLIDQLNQSQNTLISVNKYSQKDDLFTMQFSLDKKYKLLFTTFIEDALQKTPLHSVNDIKECFIRCEQNQYYVDIMGSNYDAVKQLSSNIIDLDAIYSNSVYTILQQYGVEAARNAIIEEVQNVFNNYSIAVDERHIALIADYMTLLGGYRPCNRYGIQFQPHPLLKASFERASYFVVQSASYQETDCLETPSSSITVGQLVKQGTGAFQLFQQIGE